MDLLAVELKMDPAELRIKNFIGREQFPYQSALGSITYYVGITYVPAFLTSAGGLRDAVRSGPVRARSNNTPNSSSLSGFRT